MRLLFARLLLLIIFGCFFPAKAILKKVENETTENLSKVDRLYYTCKIWGFLKYYHPKVGKGFFNWDEKMLGVLKNTSNIQTEEQFSTYISRWIHYLGPVTAGNIQSNTGEEVFLKNFNLFWLRQPIFSNELQNTFRNIERNRFQGDHYYIGRGKTGQFEPKNEESHFDLNWKDENERLLPLFRYWNYIEYFFPYKYQTDESWDAALKSLISVFLDAKTKLDFHLAMLEMVVKIDDGQAGLVTSTLDEYPYYNYLPAKFEIIDNEAVITEIIDQEKARQDGLQIGDVIQTINGKTVLETYEANSKYIWGSNPAAKKRMAYHTLFMGLKSSPQATIERNYSIRNQTLNFYRYADISYTKPAYKPKWKEIGDSIALINMERLTVPDVDPMMSLLIDKQVLIFDLRGYPKGTYRALSNYLNPKDTVFARYLKPDYSYPGKFIWSGQSSCGSTKPDYFKGMVILLVNEKTQGHSEFTCMCLQTAPNAITIGSKTAGSDGSVSKFPLYSQFGIAMTSIGVFYPNKMETQRIGIVPDIYATPTIAGVRQERDEVLEKAMEVAEEELEKIRAEALLIKINEMDSTETKIDPYTPNEDY